MDRFSTQGKIHATNREDAWTARRTYYLRVRDCAVCEQMGFADIEGKGSE